MSEDEVIQNAEAEATSGPLAELANIRQMLQSTASEVEVLAARIEKLCGCRGDAPWRFEQ